MAYLWYISSQLSRGGDDLERNSFSPFTGGLRRIQRSLEAMVDQRLFLSAMEYFLIDTCNLRCNQCATSSPYMTETNLPSLDGFKKSLSILSPIVRCDELRFVGGEPTLNKNICSFMVAAKESGMFQRLRVITNGMLLSKMSDEFWQLADVVRISIYPGTTDLFTDQKLKSFQETAAKHATRLEIIRDDKFFKATSDFRIEDAGFVQKTFDECGEANGWSCHLLYRDRVYRCSRVHTLDRHLAAIGVEHENFTDEDCLFLNHRPTLLSDIKAYLSSSTPLKACSFCYGTSGPMLEHGQLTVQEIRLKLNGLVPVSQLSADEQTRH